MALDLCLKENISKVSQIFEYLRNWGQKPKSTRYRPAPQLEKANSDKFVKHLSSTQCIIHSMVRMDIEIVFLRRYECLQKFSIIHDYTMNVKKILNRLFL